MRDGERPGLLPIAIVIVAALPSRSASKTDPFRDIGFPSWVPSRSNDCGLSFLWDLGGINGELRSLTKRLAYRTCDAFAMLGRRASGSRRGGRGFA